MAKKSINPLLDQFTHNFYFIWQRIQKTKKRLIMHITRKKEANVVKKEKKSETENVKKEKQKSSKSK